MSTSNKKLTLEHAEKAKRKTIAVLGYDIPKFTEHEWNLRNKYKAWESWTPTTKYWSGWDDWEYRPEPEDPKLSEYLLLKIKMRDEWVGYFNIFYEYELY